jgi:hypothetical protein
VDAPLNLQTMKIYGDKSKKVLQLNRYYTKTLRHVFSSQFVARNISNIPKLSKLVLSVEAKKIKKTHFMFVYLLTTGKKSHLIKYNIPKKFKRQSSRIKKRHKILCRLSKRKTEQTLNKILFNILPAIFPTEKKSLQINRHIIRLIIYQIPLIKENLALKSRSGYLPLIPLTLNFYIPYTSLYQKIFSLRALGLYSSYPIEHLEKARFI